ncbi:hypothetical protein AJ79_02444 [Helicocarpus griseus UAMH5409]|uniref:PHD-type domain-containing protein n=1 Tax=Helicocarpus griseus UAMH5409 TaxID=1447875 RepID=A0A2B7Y464_9EURO|nr:hypothetical protein AJ79_02444 [Helicocarpus griseus UAMH5409]
MAPKTRSSRATSRNTSRPSTPLDTTLPLPSSSVSGATRVRKQRKFAQSARDTTGQTLASFLGVETKTPASQPDQQPENQTTESSEAPAPPPRWDEPWVEPELPPPTPSYKFDTKKGLKYYAIAPNIPLGVLPSLALRRRLGLIPPAKVPPPAKKNGSKSAKSTPTGDERPGTASTSAGEAAPSASPFVEGLQGFENGDQGLDSARTRMGNNNIGSETAPVNGHPALPPPTLLPTPPNLKYSTETCQQVVDIAIAHAEERQDQKTAIGLRRMKEGMSQDQFLYAVLIGGFDKKAAAHEKSLFQTVFRDTVKAEQPPAPTHDSTAMTRTQSSTSTSSSLSSAKSLDAETFAPALTPGRASNPAPTKNKGGRPAKGKGKKQSVPPRSQSIFPSLEDAALRKRKRLEDPEYSDESLAVKRAALRREFPDFTVPESHIRPSRSPVANETASPTLLSSPSVGSKRSREALETVGGEAGVLTNDSRAPKRARKSAARADEMDNIDFCRACGGRGQLLCCDGCVDSFHFTCLEPPEDPNSPPEGQWFCPSCRTRGPLEALIEAVDDLPPRPYQLPADIRGYFEGAETGEDGVYKGVPVLPKGSSRARASRVGRPEDRNAYLRLTDAKGKLITCSRCGTTSNGRRPIVQCDYCPCSWHLDCLDPPRSNPPPQVPGSDNPALYWKCPNHIDHDLALMDGLGGGRLAQIRRPRNPRFVDVEVLPSDSEAERFDEQEMAGTVYRVPERGLILDFVRRVKRDHAEDQALAAIAAAETARVTAALAAPGLVFNAQGAEGTVGSRSAQDAVMASRAVNREPTVADANTALSLLAPAERDAVMALEAMTSINQPGALAYPERAAQLVKQLLASVPESARNETGEIDILRTLQVAVNQRIQALNSDAATN